MKKIMAMLTAFMLLLSAAAFADGAEPGLLRTAIGYDISTMDVADSLEGFAITDDTHFSITLSAPNAGFPAELSAPVASFVPQWAGFTDFYATDVVLK